MYCDQCGAELEANQGFCSRCGKEVKGPVAIGAPRPGRVQAHVRLLGILWLALSAFDVMTGIVGIVLANSIFSHDWGIQGLPLFLQPLIRGFAIFSLVKAAAGFFAG
jgi:hypothetical protein